jgi:hemoglobin
VRGVAGAFTLAAGGESMSPFDILGEAKVLALAERFYEVMDATEPALARLHPLDADGRVARPSRDRFAQFLVGWLGGPDTYTERHGHPRLRMRHAQVPVDAGARDAWVRCMTTAMDDVGVEGDVRTFLDARFFEVADFLRNRPG